MTMLTISASVPTQSSQSQTIGFYIGLYMVALGSGGIKPCLYPFKANQFDDTDPSERKKRGPFFNWLGFFMHIGSLISCTILGYIQDNYGWGTGFGIPTLFMGVAIVSFFIGSGVYRFQKMGGSPITRVCQVR